MIFPEEYSRQRQEIRRHLGEDGWGFFGKDCEHLLHLKWLGFQPRCIYDIGASNSIWSSLASLIFPEAAFEMFEPLAEISQSYCSARKVNPHIVRFLETARWQIHPVALGTKSGTCSFQWLEGNEAGSTSLETGGPMANAQLVEVPMHRLDDYAAARNLAPPDLLKLDTQGSEMEIFGGAERAIRAASVVFIECWLHRGYGPNNPLFLEVANHLSAAGYDLFSIGDEYRDPEGVAQSKDAVFVKRSLPLNPAPALHSPI